MRITTTVNGAPHEAEVEPRLLLVDFLRDELSLTGTHIGCEDGKCGACTIILDGEAVKSCMLFAVQADGSRLTTVEGLADGHGLTPLQTMFHRHHALQCGYCTPGFLLAAQALLQRNPDPTEEDVRRGLAGNICRCTGYTNIVTAVLAAAQGRTAGAAETPGRTEEEPVSIGEAIEVAIDEPGPEGADLDRLQEQQHQPTGARNGGERQ
jgi:carbon-monoxide dehydrogenase small subunit